MCPSTARWCADVPAITRLNTAPAPEVTARLAGCNAAPHWVLDMLAGLPYTDSSHLLQRSDTACRALPRCERDRALAGRPEVVGADDDRALAVLVETTRQRVAELLAG